MRLLQKIAVVLLGLWLQQSAYAVLELVLTQGVDKTLPIAVVAFAGQTEGDPSPNNMAAVIRADLQNSGRFQVLPASALVEQPVSAATVNYPAWQKAGADSLVIGKVQSLGGDSYKVSFNLLDTFSGAAGNHNLLSQEFTVKAGQLRQLAHHIADLIYQQLTGTRGAFATRIAYVLIQQQAKGLAKYQLIVADSDGYNPRAILVSDQPIMSPAWSHNGKRLAYVSFEGRRAQIYVSELASGRRQLISSFPGINGAPAWSMDDSKLALVLSKNGSPKIYSLDLASGSLQQMTDGSSIDTEPTWTPDGKGIAFTSDRGGAPQIYRLDLQDRSIQRLTYQGRYNARARFTPDGKRLVLLHQDQGMYNIAVQDLKAGTLQVLTRSGRSDSPSVAPNGMMVLHGTEFGELGLVSIDGGVQLRLPAQEGRVQDPAWSPFLSY